MITTRLVTAAAIGLGVLLTTAGAAQADDALGSFTVTPGSSYDYGFYVSDVYSVDGIQCSNDTPAQAATVAWYSGGGLVAGPAQRSGSPFASEITTNGAAADVEVTNNGSGSIYCTAYAR